MNYKVTTLLSLHFQKELKGLQKKYPSLKADFAALLDKLESEPFTGTPLGNNAYKIRLAIKSKGKGKSGGARVISYVETEIIASVESATVSLLTIYDKSKIDSISKERISFLIKNMET